MESCLDDATGWVAGEEGRGGVPEDTGTSLLEREEDDTVFGVRGNGFLFVVVDADTEAAVVEDDDGWKTATVGDEDDDEAATKEEEECSEEGGLLEDEDKDTG